MTLRPLLLLAALCLYTASAPGAEPYLQGGARPFPPEIKATLDAHADILSLGVNSDWFTASNIDEARFVEAIDLVARAVKAGHIPGAVIHADRINSNTMPVAIGYKMIDPQKRRVEPDTLYDVEDLTGPLITTPLVLGEILQLRLKTDTRLAELLPPFAGTDKAEITVDQLLRHTSGLPAVYTEPDTLRTREDILPFLAQVPLATKPGDEVQVSPLNVILLGLIVEKLEGKPFSEVAEAQIIGKFDLNPSRLGIEPDKRQVLAPGGYSPLLGRMAWGEAPDRIGMILGNDSPHRGFMTYSDSLGNLAKTTTPILALYTLPGSENFTPLGPLFKPSSQAKGGESMAAGFSVGRFGPRSYGWDAKGGSSVWILPEKMAYIIFLSNFNHPNGPRPGRVDPRDQVLPLLAEALKPVSPPVDTAPANPQPSPGSPPGSQPPPP
jgi:CubicO group peptidase (beta-lactamase class C family)